MIIRNHASSTAHLIEPQTLFYLVSGEKADNHIKIKETYKRPVRIKI